MIAKQWLEFESCWIVIYNQIHYLSLLYDIWTSFCECMVLLYEFSKHIIFCVNFKCTSIWVW